MMRPGQSMGNNDNIVSLFVQFAIGLKGNIIRFEDTPALQIERIGKVLGMRLQV